MHICQLCYFQFNLFLLCPFIYFLKCLQAPVCLSKCTNSFHPLVFCHISSQPGQSTGTSESVFLPWIKFNAGPTTPDNRNMKSNPQLFLKLPPKFSFEKHFVTQALQPTDHINHQVVFRPIPLYSHHTAINQL